MAPSARNRMPSNWENQTVHTDRNAGNAVRSSDLLVWRRGRIGLNERSEIVRTWSIVVRVTAWYGWVFLVLGLAFGTYIYKCLECGLSWCAKCIVNPNSGDR